jgi:hypothetical protein
MNARPVFVTWLQKNGLLTQSVTCDRCGHDCKITVRSIATDGHTWRYPNRNDTSIRHQSIIAGSHMHVEDAFNFIVTYAEGATLSHSAHISSMDYGTTAVDWANSRPQLIRSLLQRDDQTVCHERLCGDR